MSPKNPPEPRLAQPVLPSARQEADAGGGAFDSARRLDAFVDAAFAFAATFVVVSGAPSDSLGELPETAGRIPAMAACFALIVMFWLGYRNVSRLLPRRDALATGLCVVVVFLVLIYVFPLRSMFEAAFHLASGGRLPGHEAQLDEHAMRFLYLVYGLGFGLLSASFSALYGLALGRAGAALTDEVRSAARTWLACWLIMVSVATMSLSLVMIGPRGVVSWAPGVIYMLIPVAIAIVVPLMSMMERRRFAAKSPAA